MITHATPPPFGLKPMILSDVFITRCQSVQPPFFTESGSDDVNLIPFITEIKSLLDNKYSKIQLTYNPSTERQTHILCKVNLATIIIEEKKSIKYRTFIYDLKTRLLTINNRPSTREMQVKFLAKAQWFISQIDNPKMTVAGIVEGDSNDRI
ncbi:hypothetical protein HOH45_07825 [bacterium]|nr:hypothetical protein [bacterium]